MKSVTFVRRSNRITLPMKPGHTIIPAVLLALCAALAAPAPALARTGAAAEPPAGLPTDQIIIKYTAAAGVSALSLQPGSARLEALSQAAGEAITYFRPMSGDAHVVRLAARLPEAEVQAIADRLSQLPDVEYAVPDRVMRPALTPNDPQYPNQWGYSDTYGMNLPSAWDVTTGVSSTVVAVIDTGYRPHADLAGRWVAGYDFISDSRVANDGDARDADPQDPGDWITSAEDASGFFQGCGVSNSSWHGTHVAGSIGANSNNSLGVAGVNWRTRIQPVRVLGKCGGFVSDILDGMRWAAGLPVAGVPANATPARVLNMSLGGSGACNAAQQAAINAINATGAIVVVAAGNNNNDASLYNPASCAGVVVVGATNKSGTRSYYSNYGSAVHVSAPGGAQSSANDPNGILSTLNTGTTSPVADSYVYYQGTSMATPHVVGLVGLMLAISPTLNYTRADTLLRSTARAFGPGSDCATKGCGAGIVDAYAAVKAAGLVTTPAVSKRAFMPAGFKSLAPPSAPVLNSISNPGGGSSYAVTWGAVSGATGYTLQEDTSSSFTAPVTRYSGAGTTWSASGQAAGTYYYRVNASSSAGDSGWSNTQTVTVVASSGPTPGFWESTTADEFYVTPDGQSVTHFAIYISVTGCSTYKITRTATDPISNSQFSFTGTFYASGTFDSATTAHGSDGLSGFVISGCGTINGGPWAWSATWKNSSQPAATDVPAVVIGPDGVAATTTLTLQRGPTAARSGQK